MIEQNRGRTIWLDYARMLAIICVVITHTTERVYSLEAEILGQYSSYSRIFALSMHTIGRLGVPIFFFLTGYLLLDRDYPREQYIFFLKHNFAGLLRTTTIWIVIYNVFNAWFYKTPFDIKNCLKNMFFLKATDMTHMWYMPVIIGMYLFLPFVANALKYTDLKVLYIPLSIVFIYQFILPVIDVFLTVKGAEPVASLLDFSFVGNEYGFLILLGYLVKKGTFNKAHSWEFVLLGICGFVFTVFSQNYSYIHGVTYNVWYDSASLIITDLAIFILLSKANFKFGKIASKISIASFGIYLVHNPINMMLSRYYQPEASNWQRLAVIFAITFALAWGIVAIVGKKEPISRVLFFNKKSKNEIVGLGGK